MRNFKKIIRYIITPVIYAALGYLFLIIALSPIIRMTKAMGGMLLGDNAPNFNTELSVIYDPEAHQEVTSGTVPISDIQFPSRGDQYGNISCEEIGMDAPLYWGDSYAIMDYGVGHYTGSFLPGYGKMMLLAAHNTTYFSCLQNAAVGQIVKIQTNYGVFEYEITDLQVMLATDAEAKVNEWLQSEEEQLIMYTCYPFTMGDKTERLFVFAKKISGPELV